VGTSGYIGGGEITRITGFSISSKKFNMIDKGQRSQLGYIDFFVDKTDDGQIDVPIYVDYNSDDRVNNGDDPYFNTTMPTTPLPINASTDNENKVMHRFYCPLEAQFFQYELTLSEAQMCSKEIYEEPFNVNAVIIWSTIGGRLVK